MGVLVISNELVESGSDDVIHCQVKDRHIYIQLRELFAQHSIQCVYVMAKTANGGAQLDFGTSDIFLSMISLAPTERKLENGILHVKFITNYEDKSKASLIAAYLSITQTNNIYWRHAVYFEAMENQALENDLANYKPLDDQSSLELQNKYRQQLLDAKANRNALKLEYERLVLSERAARRGETQTI